MARARGHREFVRDRFPVLQVGGFDRAVAFVAVHVEINDPFVIDPRRRRPFNPVRAEGRGGRAVRPRGPGAHGDAQVLLNRVPVSSLRIITYPLRGSPAALLTIVASMTLNPPS